MTPKEIRNQQFGLKFRGFDIEEVDNFLEQVANEFDLLLKENIILKEDSKKKSTELETLRLKDEELKKTIQSLQRLQEDLTSDVNKKNDVFLKEAEKKAQEIIKGAHEKVSSLKTQKDTLVKEIRNVLNSHLALLGEDLKEDKQSGKKDIPAQKMEIFELDLDEDYDGKLEIGIPRKQNQNK